MTNDRAATNAAKETHMNGGGEIVLMVDQLEQMERERHAILQRDARNLCRRLTNSAQRRRDSLVAETRRLTEHLTRFLARLEKDGLDATVDPLGEIQGAGPRIDAYCAQFAQAQEALIHAQDLGEPEVPNVVESDRGRPRTERFPSTGYVMSAFMTSEGT